jgi:HlyD family secretion protein
VSRLHVEDRQAVARDTALVTVVDLSGLEIEIAVAESDADEILPGTPVEVMVGSTAHAATVHSIAPEVQGARVLGRVAFAGPPPEGLKQNQRVRARLRLETRPDVIKVARGPFLETGGGRQAYRIRDDVAELVTIVVGSVSVSEVEIRSGLEPGDRIVVSETTRFEGADRVLIR